MSDMKKAFEQAGITEKGSGTMSKRCKECGNEFTPKESHHIYCFDCIKKRRGGSFGTEKSNVKLPAHYLTNSYFDEKGYLRAGIFKEEAKEVAGVLAALDMTPTSLRAFYNKLKAIESQYRISNNNFDLIKPKLYAFERDVAYQVSRGVVPEEFRTFINKNADLAIKGPDEFKGFLEHFLSVLSYFKDVPKK